MEPDAGRAQELETERIMQQIERGTWDPPRLQLREDRLDEAMAALGVQVDENFRVFAKRRWRSKQLDLAEKTFVDYSWRLAYLERFFGRYRLSEITPRLVDRFRDELAEQAQTIRMEEQRGRPVMETATDKRGRTYERRRRPLSNTSINMLITLLGQILQQAVDYELIDRNPVRVGGPAARFLKRARPDRTFLEVDEFHALLERWRRARGGRAGEPQGAWTAGDDRDARAGRFPNRGDDGPEGRACRSAALPFQTRQREDRGRRAGGRDHALPARRAARLRDDRQARGLPNGPSDHFFGTATGRRRDPDRFRDRILARAVARANANRAESGLLVAPLPPITPHSLRRTWATFCAMIGRDPKWVASLARSDTSTRSSRSLSTSRSRPAATSTSRLCGH
jgi:integrase